MAAGKLQRLFLLRGKADAELRFDLRRDLLCVRRVAVFFLRHGEQPLGGVALVLVQARKVACLDVRYRLAEHLPAVEQHVQTLADKRFFHGNELRRSGDQLCARNKAVPVAGIVRQLEQNCCRNALGAVAVEALSERERVRLRKGGADRVRRENVRVLLHQLQRLVSIKLIHAHGDNRPDGRGCEKLDQPPEPGLPVEMRGHLFGLG